MSFKNTADFVSYVFDNDVTNTEIQLGGEIITMGDFCLKLGAEKIEWSKDVRRCTIYEFSDMSAIIITPDSSWDTRADNCKNHCWTSSKCECGFFDSDDD